MINFLTTPGNRRRINTLAGGTGIEDSMIELRVVSICLLAVRHAQETSVHADSRDDGRIFYSKD